MSITKCQTDQAEKMWISLKDIYTEKELLDETENLFNFVPQDYENILFEVTIESAEQLKTLRDIAGEYPILISYRLNAETSQKKIVSYYRNQMKIGAEIAPIVISSGSIVDGNHRVIAAILSNTPLKVIDLEKWKKIDND